MDRPIRRVVHGAYRSAARWLTVLLLAVIVALLVRELVCSAPPAVAQTGVESESPNVFAVAGQISKDTYGLYLVDLKNETMCVYELRGSGRLRLLAARTFTYDRQLDSYNTEPLPRDVAKMVAGARRLTDVAPTTRP